MNDDMLQPSSAPWSHHALRSRLDDARRLLDEEQPDLAAVSDAVADALDRVRALELTTALFQQDDASACTVVSGRQAEPVTEWLLIPFGSIDVERPLAGRSFVFAREHAESAKRWFDALGRKLAIDYEHQSIAGLNGRSDGLRPAAGWIGGLEVRDDGLWAVDVTWTDRARALLASGEYRYFSPVIYWTDADYADVAALGPVALTNDPAMRRTPALAAGRDDEALRTALAQSQTEAARLREQLRLQAADAFVERGMLAGKISDATSMDWRDEHLADPERAETRLARMPAMFPPGRIAPSAGASAQPSASALRRGGIEPEDLTTYQRAQRDGRVIHSGGWRG